MDESPGLGWLLSTLVPEKFVLLESWFSLPLHFAAISFSLPLVVGLMRLELAVNLLSPLALFPPRIQHVFHVPKIEM